MEHRVFFWKIRKDPRAEGMARDEGVHKILLGRNGFTQVGARVGMQLE